MKCRQTICFHFHVQIRTYTNFCNDTVVYQPLLCPSYVISTTSGRFPADGAGKPLSRAARRSLQLVITFSSSKVINVFRMSCVQVLRPRPGKLRPETCGIIRKHINNGFLSNRSPERSFKTADAFKEVLQKVRTRTDL